MGIPSYYDLSRQWTVPIPQRVDGSGVVELKMSAGNMKAFGLDEFPRPKDHGAVDPISGKRVISIQPNKGGANQGSFRLAYSWATEGTKPLMARFRLSSRWRMETLQVITNYLVENYDGWFEIRNEHGNNVWGSYFSRDAARLRGRACS